MEQSVDPTTTLDASSLQNLLGDSASSLIPESLITTLTVGFIVLNVLGILFLLFYIINAIRKWKVESAVFHMQKDLAEVKSLLAAQQKPVIVPPITPANNNPVIARSDSPYSDQAPSNLS